VLLAAGLFVAALVPLMHLLLSDRSGVVALDKELQAAVAATSVLDYLRTVPYAALPAIAGEPGVSDAEWNTLTLRCPDWGGAVLGQRFHPLSLDGPFERWLQLQELTPWPGSSRTVKLASVTVRWTQPGPEGRDRGGQLVMRTVLSPANGLDETVVLEP
jgi:hypothetical protein